MPPAPRVSTRILRIPRAVSFGRHVPANTLERWEMTADAATAADVFAEAAHHLRSSDVPVAFPTETVYGLGADATRSAAVRGIYKAKGRPADNPLIVHVCDMAMLEGLLAGEQYGDVGARKTSRRGEAVDDAPPEEQKTWIPHIYRPLIRRFWPGPLTIILPVPPTCRLAPEVTCGMPTVGVRMPAAGPALTLIQLADVPLAAPSANASTRPSCTSAEHVRQDLDGRIEIILDGGPCNVGVESTIVDGLGDVPCVLRPGGVSIEEIRQVPGWEGVVKAYRDADEGHGMGFDVAPRAPGMKYKHYSPRAMVILYEASSLSGTCHNLIEELGRMAAQRNDEKAGDADANRSSATGHPTIGIITTLKWDTWAGLDRSRDTKGESAGRSFSIRDVHESTASGFTMTTGDLYTEETIYAQEDPASPASTSTFPSAAPLATLHSIALGRDLPLIARGLFSAFRHLDARACAVICVEGVSSSSSAAMGAGANGEGEGEGRDLGEGGNVGEDVGEHLGAAVMNRLRKAATRVVVCGERRR